MFGGTRKLVWLEVIEEGGEQRERGPESWPQVQGQPSYDKGDWKGGAGGASENE